MLQCYCVYFNSPPNNHCSTITSKYFVLTSATREITINVLVFVVAAITSNFLFGLKHCLDFLLTNAPLLVAVTVSVSVAVSVNVNVNVVVVGILPVTSYVVTLMVVHFKLLPLLL